MWDERQGRRGIAKRDLNSAIGENCAESHLQMTSLELHQMYLAYKVLCDARIWPHLRQWHGGVCSTTQFAWLSYESEMTRAHRSAASVVRQRSHGAPETQCREVEEIGCQTRR
jgi:hypothetical protein